MALTLRTISQMLNLADTILAARATDVLLTPAEQLDVTNARTSLAAVALDVDLATNLVPALKQQIDHDTLKSQVSKLAPAETRLNTKTVDFYDALDLMFDAANAVVTARSSVTSDLGDPNQKVGGTNV